MTSDHTKARLDSTQQIHHTRWPCGWAWSGYPGNAPAGWGRDGRSLGGSGASQHGARWDALTRKDCTTASGPTTKHHANYLSVCLPACGWQRQSTTAKQLANHCNSIHCAQKTGPTTHVEIHLTKQIELSYDQLIAASLIGQNAVM